MARLSVPPQKPGDEKWVATAFCFCEQAAALRNAARGALVSVIGSAEPTVWQKEGKAIAGISIMADSVMTLGAPPPAWADNRGQQPGPWQSLPPVGQPELPGAGGWR
jgi:hypothetical protein